MVDVEGGNNMMYLPLDKLAERSQTNAAAAGGAVDARTLRQITDAVTEQLRRDASSSRTTSRGGR